MSLKIFTFLNAQILRKQYRNNCDYHFKPASCHKGAKILLEIQVKKILKSEVTQNIKKY